MGENASVLKRLKGVGCGTWELNRKTGELLLDATSQSNLKLGASLSWEEFLSRVHPQDRVELRERAAEGLIDRVWAPFRFTRGDGKSIRVEAVGTSGDVVSKGILLTVADPETLQGPLSGWFTSFADGLGGTRTSSDVAYKVQELGEEVLGVTFAGLSIPDAESGELNYLMAKPLPVGAGGGWGSYAPDSDNPVAEVARSGKVLYFLTRKELLKHYPQLESMILEIGLQGWGGFPMRVSGKTIGVLVLHWKHSHEFTAHELGTLKAIADQVGQALERAFLYERREGVMSVLQQVVLPAKLPDNGGLQLAARYLPTDRGVEVGGDWYDAFKAPSGETVLALGDVAGHGLKAAATMGQLRNALRAYVAMGLEPNQVLTMLNKLALNEEDTYATVVCGFYNPSQGRFRWSSAGHFPPILEEGGKVRSLDPSVGPLLGASEDARYGLNQESIPHGATLALYTDGLIEDRSFSLDQGISRVESALEESTKTALEVRCHQVLEAALQGRERRDDLCLLLARRAGFGEKSAVRTFAQALKTPAAAREFLREHLEQWSASELEESAALLISEAVTNAVVHARSSVRVSIRLDEDTLTVSVQDKSVRQPELKHPGQKAVDGRGVALIDIISHSWGVDYTTGGKNVWFSLRKA